LRAFFSAEHSAMVREARVENIFRYAHVFPRCVAMLASGAIDVKPLITRTVLFETSTIKSLLL
jgi:D-xylulose reductase